jgi:hypothetical protein
MLRFHFVCFFASINDFRNGLVAYKSCYCTSGLAKGCSLSGTAATDSHRTVKRSRQQAAFTPFADSVGSTAVKA